MPYISKVQFPNDSNIYDIQDDGVRESYPLAKSTSGSIVSFDDGANAVPVEALSIALEPVQDLHGQPSPYPAGGGINRWDEEWELGYLGVDGGNVSYIASTSRIRSKNWIPVTSGNTYYYNGSGYGAFIVGADDTNGTNAVLVVSSDNAGFTFTPNKPYIKFAPREGYGATYKNDISVNYPSTDTAYHPYSNICPITGYTQAEIWRAGSNLIDFDGREQYAGADFRPDSVVDFSKPYVYYGIASSGYRFSNNVPSDVVISSDNCITLTPRYDWYGVGFNIPIKGGATYSRNAASGGYAIGVAFYDADSKYISTANSQTFTAPSNAVNAIVVISAKVETGTVSAENVRVVVGNNTSAEYKSPSMVNIEIPLGQTIYSATVDVVRSVCGSNMAILELGNLNWAYDSGYNRFAVNGAWGQKAPANNETKANIVSDRYKTVTDNQTASADYNCSIGMSLAGRLDIRDESFGSDVAAFKASLSGAQLCYELATPVTLDLTDIPELTTLLGQNNIWSDAGDVSLTYRTQSALTPEGETIAFLSDIPASSNNHTQLLAGDRVFRRINYHQTSLDQQTVSGLAGQSITNTGTSFITAGRSHQDNLHQVIAEFDLQGSTLRRTAYSSSDLGHCNSITYDEDNEVIYAVSGDSTTLCTIQYDNFNNITSSSVSGSANNITAVSYFDGTLYAYSAGAGKIGYIDTDTYEFTSLVTVQLPANQSSISRVTQDFTVYNGYAYIVFNCDNQIFKIDLSSGLTNTTYLLDYGNGMFQYGEVESVTFLNDQMYFVSSVWFPGYTDGTYDISYIQVFKTTLGSPISFSSTRGQGFGDTEKVYVNFSDGQSTSNNPVGTQSNPFLTLSEAGAYISYNASINPDRQYCLQIYYGNGYPYSKDILFLRNCTVWVRGVSNLSRIGRIDLRNGTYFLRQVTADTVYAEACTIRTYQHDIQTLQAIYSIVCMGDKSSGASVPTYDLEGCTLIPNSVAEIPDSGLTTTNIVQPYVPQS